MRAIIREILARRMPGPPMEFVAIQTSRLNEALLVAYSAMSPTNLGAVDRVIKIVRELDRYRGFCAAERRRPEASSELEARAFDAAAEKSAFAKLAAEDPDEDRICRTWTSRPTPSPTKARNRRRPRPNLPRRRAQSGKGRNGPTVALETPNPVIARSEATKQPMPPLRPTVWIASPSARNDDARRALAVRIAREIRARSEDVQPGARVRPGLDASSQPASETCG